MDPVSTRLPPWLRNELVHFGRSLEEGPGEALRRVAQEWWAMNELPAITFRDGPAGRRAGIRGGPDVWEVVMVRQDYAPPDDEGFYAHWQESVTREALDEALRYYERFPEEIDARIALNERIAEQLERGGAVR